MAEAARADAVAQWLVDHGLKFLWYICRIENLHGVFRHGILCKNVVRRRGLPHASFAEETVQARRRAREIPTSAGLRRTVHDMVPLYFTPRTPTLSARRDQSDRLALLRLPAERVLVGGIEFAFSDGNAGSRETRVYCHQADLPKLDLAVLRASTWSGDSDAKRRRCAELLVADVPAECIDRIVVRRHGARVSVERESEGGVAPIPLDIVPRYFFDDTNA
jgi:ssDNA thymidine ADP-ribosyltransferase, DarT